MPDRFIQTHIRRLPLFQGLSRPQLEQVAGVSQVLRFEPGEWIFRQGETSRGLYMFISGQAILTQTGRDGLERQVGTVGENQYVNQGALFREVKETSSMRVTHTAIVLLVERRRFMTLLHHRPEIKAGLGMQEDSPHQFKKAAFKGQGANEHVLLVTRRHWWAFVRGVWVALLLFAVMAVLGTAAPSGLLTTTLYGLALLFPGLFMLYRYIEWHNDKFIITDKRIIRIEHVILTFRESRRVVALESIHEINIDLPAWDIFARIFDYGDIELKTAGEAGNIVLEMLPHPDHIQETILADRDQFLEEEARNRRQRISADIDKILNLEGAGEMGDGGQQGGGPPPAGTKKQREAPSAENMNFGFQLPLKTQFTSPSGEMVYRKHYIVWVRHILLLGLRFLF